MSNKEYEMIMYNIFIFKHIEISKFIWVLSKLISLISNYTLNLQLPMLS